jgi:hypothetical protein
VRLDNTLNPKEKIFDSTGFIVKKDEPKIWEAKDEEFEVLTEECILKKGRLCEGSQKIIIIIRPTDISKIKFSSVIWR